MVGSTIPVGIETLPHCFKMPEYQTNGASGLDIYAADNITLRSYESALVATGFALAIPEGYEGQIRPRSGWALKRGITVLNSPGTVDADYRGEVKVLLINLSMKIQNIDKGDRIAQLVFAPVNRVQFIPAVVVPKDTARGAGGFGSTGQ
jgi:dUTP pyrophosphatase